MLLKVVAFLIGILSNIVDYMNDSKIFTDYKLLLYCDSRNLFIFHRSETSWWAHDAKS